MHMQKETYKLITEAKPDQLIIACYLAIFQCKANRPSLANSPDLVSQSIKNKVRLQSSIYSSLYCCPHSTIAP